MSTNTIPEHDKRRPIDSNQGPHKDVAAAYDYVSSIIHTADDKDQVVWHGWALREAFLAGCSHEANK